MELPEPPHPRREEPRVDTSPPSYPLPPSADVPVEFLAATLRSTTNSYKYLWLLALVEVFGEPGADARGLRIPMDEMLSRMLSIAWYPIRRFRLSFGTQDRVGRAVGDLADALGDPRRDTGVRRDEIRAALASDRSLHQDLERYVPYRFLTPWFPGELKGRKDSRKNPVIRECAAGGYGSRERAPLYRFRGERDEEIEVHPAWAAYLVRHAEVVAGFARWHLVRYLESRNPGVPNLAGKLAPPEARNLSRPRKLWGEILDRSEGVTCVYTGRPVTRDSFSLDHFVPWSFVAHDLLWNLAPVPREVNSSKGDQLPALDRHLPAFARIQRQAFHLWTGRHRRAVEEFVDAFREEPAEIRSWDEREFEHRLRSVLLPLLETARNRGFPPWPAG